MTAANWYACKIVIRLHFIWILYRTQLKDGQAFDDPTALYFTELNVQSGNIVE